MGESINNFSVSVVIPAYNATRTIVRTLESVRNQTRADLIHEVIVVNDGSKDDTVQVVNEYAQTHPELPVVLIDKQNGGVSTARNAGMKAAGGSWIALLDSDDEWVPEKLQLQYETVCANPQIDFLGGNHYDNVISILGKKITALHKATVKELCIKSFPQPSTVVMKKEIFDTLGGFDETRRYAEDGQYFCKVCAHYGYYYMPQQLVVYDGGRRGFGAGGLSGNLKGMQDGLRKNMKEQYDNKRIGFGTYMFVSLFNEIKYIRRILICALEKK